MTTRANSESIYPHDHRRTKSVRLHYGVYLSLSRSSQTASRLLSAVFVGLALLATAPVSLLASTSPADQKTGDYALIFGTVWGPDSRPRYGVPVKIRRANEKKARWETMSDHHGEFAQRVPTGKADYVIWADIKVPKGKEKPQVTVHVQDNERVDTGLHLTE